MGYLKCGKKANLRTEMCHAAIDIRAARPAAAHCRQRLWLGRSATTPMLAINRARRDAYAAMIKGEPDALVGCENLAKQEEIRRTIDLEVVKIERRLG
jgi:hypothetical protein